MGNMTFDYLTEFLDSIEARYGIPAFEIRITKDHEELYHYVKGHKDAAGMIPAGEDDWYNLYSCTKVITMVAVMQLIESHKMHLYDPVYLYLPEMEFMKVYDQDYTALKSFLGQVPPENAPCHYAQNPIRIIDLMSMRAGFSYNLQTPEIKALVERTNGKATTREVIRELAKAPLLYEPGTDYMYSLAHDVLAAVIEEVSGEKYSEYLKKHIFEPCGARDLLFNPPEEQKDRFSTLYMYDAAGKKIIPIDAYASSLSVTRNYESGGGGLCGTVGSYSKIMEALANGGLAANGNRILKEESVMHFTVGVTHGKAQESFIKQDKGAHYTYGLGVRVHCNQLLGRSPIGEFGWDGFAGSYGLVDPFNHISITYAHNINAYFSIYEDIHAKIRDMLYEILQPTI